jgi:hypothetical protein
MLPLQITSDHQAPSFVAALYKSPWISLSDLASMWRKHMLMFRCRAGGYLRCDPIARALAVMALIALPQPFGGTTGGEAEGATKPRRLSP